MLWSTLTMTSTNALFALFVAIVFACFSFERWTSFRSRSAKAATLDRFNHLLDLKRLGSARAEYRTRPAFKGNLTKKLDSIRNDANAAFDTLNRLNSFNGSPPFWLQNRPSPTGSIVSQASSLSFILVDDDKNPVVYSSSPEIPSPPSPPVAVEARKAALVMLRICLFELTTIFNADLDAYEDKMQVAMLVDEIVQLRLDLMLSETTLKPTLVGFLASALRSLDTFLSVYTYEAILKVCQGATEKSPEEGLLGLCAAKFAHFMPNSPVCDGIITETTANFVLFALCANSRYSARYLLDLYPKVMSHMSQEPYLPIVRRLLEASSQKLATS